MGARRKATNERRWARGAGREAPSARRLSGGPGGPHPFSLTGMPPDVAPAPDLSPAARDTPPPPTAPAPDAPTTEPAAPYARPPLPPPCHTFVGERGPPDTYQATLAEASEEPTTELPS